MQIASRKVIAGLMVSALCITTLSSAGSDVEAKAKASLKTKKISVKVGKKKSILIKNKTKKHSYSFTSSNKSNIKREGYRNKSRKSDYNSKRSFEKR